MLSDINCFMSYVHMVLDYYEILHNFIQDWIDFNVSQRLDLLFNLANKLSLFLSLRHQYYPESLQPI